MELLMDCVLLSIFFYERLEREKTEIYFWQFIFCIKPHPTSQLEQAINESSFHTQVQFLILLSPIFKIYYFVHILTAFPW